MKLQRWKFSTPNEDVAQPVPAADPGTPQAIVLSGRALNVLKVLAAELTGEIPPRGAWDPPEEMLRKLTAKHLALARNCGPRTTREIIAWAGARGVHIEPPPGTSKSLSAAWQELVANASSGKLTRTEITAALERSIRRRSARIPVAFQIVLLKILSSTYE
jgi:hypothetical protein